MSILDSNKLKQLAVLGIIVLLASFLLFSLSKFIVAGLGAVIFYIACRPLMNWFVTKGKLSRKLAAVVVMLISFLIILLPVFGLTYLLAKKINSVLNHTDIQATAIQLENYIVNVTGFDVFSEETIQKIQTFGANVLPGFLSETLSIFADIAIMYFVLFYLLSSIGNLGQKLNHILPFTQKSIDLFREELKSQTYSNVIGAPLLAMLQGIVAFIGFWFFGLKEPFFWGIMCGFFSFIPFVGSALIWFPAAMYQYSIGLHWQGTAILIYGSLVITNIDNVFRFMLQKKFADVHPLITIFGVIIGLEWFGIPGIIFGPLLISYFLILLQVYRTEYLTKKETTVEIEQSNLQQIKTKPNEEARTEETSTE
ncbi:MAG: AI-2E family transporter [Bacteroidota bacterium]